MVLSFSLAAGGNGAQACLKKCTTCPPDGRHPERVTILTVSYITEREGFERPQPANENEPSR
jgi:hypothetical protein